MSKTNQGFRPPIMAEMCISVSHHITGDEVFKYQFDYSKVDQGFTFLFDNVVYMGFFKAGRTYTLGELQIVTNQLSPKGANVYVPSIYNTWMPSHDLAKIKTRSSLQNRAMHEIVKEMSAEQVKQGFLHMDKLTVPPEAHSCAFCPDPATHQG